MAAKANIKEEKARLTLALKDAKARVESELKRYKSALLNLRALILEYEGAYTRYVAKPTEKNNKKAEEIMSRVKASNALREALSRRIVAMRTLVNNAATALITLLGETSRAGAAELLAHEKYNTSIDVRIQDMERGIVDRLPDREIVVHEEPVLDAPKPVEDDTADAMTDTTVTEATVTEDSTVTPDVTDTAVTTDTTTATTDTTPTTDTVAATTDTTATTDTVAAPLVPIVETPTTVTEPVVEVAHAAPTYTATSAVTATATSINVAPVNLDVTPMIERAISVAIEQLSAGLEAKLRDYVAGLAIPSVQTSVASGATPAVTASGATTELETHLLEGQTEVYNKLKDMCESIDTLLAGIAEVSGTYLTLTQKLKEVSDAQRQVNDMQRQTMRDQQGIQVSQRLINDEQLELATQQALIKDKQAEVSEAVATLQETQAKLLETEQTMLVTQREIESGMREFVDIEKAMLAAQTAIVQSTAKVQQAQDALAQRQEAVVAQQRETQALQRAVERGQRSTTRRATKKGDAPAESVDEKQTPEEVEVPVPVM